MSCRSAIRCAVTLLSLLATRPNVTVPQNNEALADGVKLGIATGFLSQMGPAAVVVNTDPNKLPGFLANAQAERVVLFASLTEAIANAFVSFLPPRNSVPGVTGRLISGAAAGGLLAMSRKEPVAETAAITAVAAGGASLVSTPLRRLLGRFLPDVLVAVGETGLALVLANAATRR